MRGHTNTLYAYDAMGRLAAESLGTPEDGPVWMKEYEYDDAGNRAHVDGGPVDYDFTHGAGNREVTSYNNNAGTGGDSRDPLTYDFKGNVTRVTLAPEDVFNYGWDAYDRLVHGEREGYDYTVDYDYDSMGRLLRRVYDPTGLGAPSAAPEQRFNYWLGLNKLAEGVIADGVTTAGLVVRVGDEAQASPQAAGWGRWGNSDSDQVLAWVADAERGRVARMRHTTDDNNYDAAQFGIGDYYSVGDENANGASLGSERRVLSFWMKNNFQPGMLTHAVVIRAEVHIAAGTQFELEWDVPAEAGWRFYEFDLDAKLQPLLTSYEPFGGLDAVHFTCNDISIDDMMLSDQLLGRSWQLVPGMALGGVLGAQTGSAGAADVDTNASCVAAWGKYYYHYNDLGTVLATTDEDGWPIGIYQPDFYGNYHAAAKYGDRPDTMGLTGKFEDRKTKLYYVVRRWNDPERGRFLNKDPLGFIDSFNVYAFTINNPANFTDINGLSIYSFTKCMAACMEDNDPIDSFLLKALAAIGGMPLPKTFIAQLFRFVGMENEAGKILATMRMGGSRFTTMPSTLNLALRGGGRGAFRMLGRYVSPVVVAYGVALAGVETACLGQCFGADDYCPDTDLKNIPGL